MGGGPVLAIVPAVVNIDTLNPKFSPQLQGLRHTPFTHDLSVEQSVSAIHPPTSLTVFVGLHVPLPLLIYPSGHIQIIVRTGAVGVTSHSAGLLHGSKVKQGSTHSSFMHARRAGQSVSALQVGSGSVMVSYRMATQFSAVSLMVSGGHLQTMVRKGSVSSTTHDCCGGHTCDNMHGLEHCWLIQANCVEQSASCVHSGFSGFAVLKPQEPGHGSLHCSFIHAMLLVHSALMVHSGRQFGGIPTYCNKQLQEASSFTILHCEYGPHGEGMHGFLGLGSCLRSGEG
uniref:Uncharacterized protein n=1 Tax=Glossina austeni TaxID=7395 RepID=A0A1A9VW35_GLOAU